MSKVKKLKFYTVSNNYIEKLREIDSKVMLNKNSKRPYVGIIIRINNFDYFAPLSSPKPKHKNIKSSIKMHKLIDGENFYGVININNMIPVPKNQIKFLDYSYNNKTIDTDYKNLLSKQHAIIKKDCEKICKKAQRLYQLVINKNENILKSSCDFALLEKKCAKHFKENDFDR